MKLTITENQIELHTDMFDEPESVRTALERMLPVPATSTITSEVAALAAERILELRIQQYQPAPPLIRF